jgi:hypothetical protein
VHANVRIRDREADGRLDERPVFELFSDRARSAVEQLADGNPGITVEARRVN